MDALLTALIGCFLGEIGGKGQLLLLALANRFQRDGAVMAGLAVAAAANAAIAAFAGALIGPMLAPDARLLFLALALLFLGAGMLWPVKAPDPLTGWRLGPFLTTALGCFILGFGEGAQFLVLGMSARTLDPVMAAAGGAAGVIAASVPVILLRDRFLRLPIRSIRAGGAIVLLLIALVVGVSALGLL